ncbi:MAG: 2-oxoglutarate dehydrogenase complex dihydrolipoyllysine-residue succinyltransferase [Bacteroidia bacterium]|nr:2-oxoglutarate dehydrogenase complex dihydrolipoyllysine-residue succinyltransferase [Bacteroidia bacterium]
MSIIEMRVPTIGESVTEVTLSQWLKNDGDFVNLDEPICEFESDKATLEFPAEVSGQLKYVAGEGDDLEIGALVATIDTSVVGSTSADQPKTASKPVPESQPTGAKDTSVSGSEKSYPSGHPSPAAAKILREANIDHSHVPGSGKDGRITKEDALKAVSKKASSQQTAPTSSGVKKEEEAPTSGVISFSRKKERKKMTRMRRTIASRLVQAKNESAMLTTFNEVDLSEVMKIRKKYQEEFVEKYGVKLGFMSIFAKACAKALMEMPEVNAQIDEDHLIYHDYVDIAFAISTETGLVVPPIRNCESLGYHEIEIKLKELAKKAREGKLTLEEMTGGTFSITNGGVFGSLLSTPILNRPQSAILGMHGIQQRPVAVNGEVVIRPMMYLALSYDHQVIDGRSSVTFLVKVKQLLEDPVKLLFGL